MTGGDPAATDGLHTLQEADEICLGGRADAPKLTVDDVVLLLLYADPRPMRGRDSQVRQVLLAATGVLRGSGVEPALFRGGRAGPSAAHVDDAVEQLVFSNRVRMSGDRGSRDFAIEITPRGRTAIREKYESLPPAVRGELSQRRAEWDAPQPRPPAARGAAAARRKTLLKNGAPAAGELGGRRGRRGRPPAKKPPAPGEAEAVRLQRYVDRGDRLLEEGRYDEAYAVHKLAAGLCTPGAGLHLRMARSMAEMELYKDALRHCRAAIRADPAGAACYAAAGHCLSRLGRHAEALPYHQRATRLDPGNTTAHHVASFSLFQLGRYEEALRHAESAAKMQPKDPAAHARVAACLSRLGRHEEVASAGRRAIEAGPGRADSYLPLITSLLGLGRYEEALEWCGLAIEADCGSPLPHSIMALSLRELGRREEALVHCKKSVELDPSNSRFHAIASGLLRELGRREEALVHCKKSVELDPSNSRFHAIASGLLRELGRREEALSHCKAAVSATPGSLPALSNTGSMLAEHGWHRKALECFDKALRIDPEHPVPRYNRALSLQATGRPRRALGEYRRVMALDPANIGALNNAGTVLSALGRDSDALAHFDRALELSPGNAIIHLNKALSLQLLALHREALAHFDRALELSPGNADAHVGRASCLAELGLPDEKIGSYAREVLGSAAAAGGAGSVTAGRRTAPSPPRPATAQGGAPGGERARRVKPLLSKDESKTLEFKSWPDSRPNRPNEPYKMEETIARELCSLANTEGGDLLVGVGDGGKAEGLAPGGRRLSRKERDDVLAWMTNVIVDYFGAEHDGRFDREIAEVDGLDVLHCAVAASKDGPVILKKRLGGKDDFFMRAGSSCRALGSKDMLEYVNARWPKWDSRPQSMERLPMAGRGDDMGIAALGGRDADLWPEGMPERPRRRPSPPGGEREAGGQSRA